MSRLSRSVKTSRSKPKNRQKASPSLELEISAGRYKSYAPYIQEKLLAAHRLLGAEIRELSLAFVGDKIMSQLHLHFMGIDGPTDVLTFPLEMGHGGRVLSGEVVVCVSEAGRQAREHGTSTRDEVLLYALHGLLHLCGFDDRSERTYKIMHAREDDILTRLGVGRVFDRPAAGASAGQSAGKPPARTNSRSNRRARGAIG